MSELMPGSGVPRPDHLLDPGEVLIWWDSPYPRYYAQHPRPENIAGGIFAVVFMVVWVTIAYQAGSYLWLIGLVGLGYIFGSPASRSGSTVKRRQFATC
ncbi:MAG TPA: hypothetical protein VGO06_18850 [Bosea sp. (in: a-proteobacteria)]|jgi:hypothetical protein|uniref:hypothetical protein n=1 Tax=Bosea sp. (in: a-proteobacteria) TaxID=1871050 RepID=UPI002E132ADF|nr:hypothetical protein [Bosea sp. (in: a-proteobacteria)]